MTQRRGRSLKRHGIILILLLIGLAMTAIAGFLFVGLDQIVHGDLYRYGLKFDYAWAGQYWTYSRFITESLAITMVVMGLAVVALLLNHPTCRTDYAKSLYFPLLLIGMVTVGFSVFFVTRLDYVVNSELYRYGLYYSAEWASGYWAYLRSILFLFGFVASVIAVSIGLAFASKPSQHSKLTSVVKGHSRKFKWMNLVIVILFSSGVALLTLSIGVNSTFLAILGLGLMFWCAILLFIKPEKYVKKILLEKTALPSILNLGQTIREMGYKGTPIFLPPPFSGSKSCIVYVSAKEGGELPSLEEVNSVENGQFLRHAQGLFLRPTGIELAELAEKKIGRITDKENLQYLGRKLPQLLVEDFELAESVRMEINNSIVLVKIKGSVYGDVCRETGRFTKSCTPMGCPLCSSIACLLAESTHRPIAIETDRAREDGKFINIEYRIL